MVLTAGGFIFFPLGILCHLCLSYYVFFNKFVSVCLVVLVQCFKFWFWWVRSISITFHPCFYSFHYRSATIHHVFMSLCFSIICFMFHSIPSSSSPDVLHYHNDLHLTASSEFSSFDTILLSFFLTFQRTRMSYTNNIFISLLILLSGDIQSNLDLFLVSLLSTCALLTSGLSLILFTIPLLLT